MAKRKSVAAAPNARRDRDGHSRSSANARRPRPGWVAPHRQRSNWHYTRHGRRTLCGNQPVSDAEKRYPEPETWRSSPCRRCQARLESSRGRYLRSDYR